jgi:hypothetical protein
MYCIGSSTIACKVFFDSYVHHLIHYIASALKRIFSHVMTHFDLKFIVCFFASLLLCFLLCSGSKDEASQELASNMHSIILPVFMQNNNLELAS